jgi:hypothetical protein
MAFTEATLIAQIDPANTGKIIKITRYVVAPVTTEVYAVGITAPYAGRSRWVSLTNSNTAAQAATQLQNALIL